MRFTELKVERYRSLVDATLPLRGLNVLIGPNGSGKTSVLEILQLLRDAMQKKMSEALEKLGGVNAVLSRIADGPERLDVSLRAEVERERRPQVRATQRKEKTALPAIAESAPPEPMHYCFALTPEKVGYTISSERLEWRWDPSAAKPYVYIDCHHGKVYYEDPEAKKMVRPTWDYHPFELALAQVPPMYEAPEALRSALSKTRLYTFLDVGRRAVVRLPQSLTPTVTPGPNGESLYSALYNIRASHPQIYSRMEDVLRSAFSDFRQLEFPVVGAGQVTLAWYQDDLSGPLYPGELSEGTLRFLWLTAVLLTPSPAPITLIDEPEVSLHPEMLQLLANLLQDAALRGQVIVATHASDLVRWLQPQEVLVLDKEEGRTRFTWADTLDLDNWLRKYTLAELWRMGTLGGRQ